MRVPHWHISQWSEALSTNILEVVNTAFWWLSYLGVFNFSSTSNKFMVLPRKVSNTFQLVPDILTRHSWVAGIWLNNVLLDQPNAWTVWVQCYYGCDEFLDLQLHEHFKVKHWQYSSPQLHAISGSKWAAVLCVAAHNEVSIALMMPFVLHSLNHFTPSNTLVTCSR